MPPRKSDAPGGDEKRASHSIDDHMFGDFFPHEHGADADHDHDDVDPGPLEDNPIWQRDNVSLQSVGIDIGSAGTQVIFSSIHLQRQSDALTTRYAIVDRHTAYQSPVAFTPYADSGNIDSAALGTIVDQAYAQAGVSPRDIDTGVVILTGEALRRENAEAIAGLIAETGGEFVTATAGHHMEAMLAAYGSGAAKYSQAEGLRILNIDIGGGTTKLSLIDRGHIRWTAALDIGGRLIVVAEGRVRRLDPAGAYHARRAGFDLARGGALPEGALAQIASVMADTLVDAIRAPEPSGALKELYLTDLPGDTSALDGIMVSGGVGEYVYRREARDFGDLGIHLGAAIRARADAGRFGAPLLPAGACIRATALGASEYSVQLSGQTSTITNPGSLLPRRNMQVVKPDLDLSDSMDRDEIADAIRSQYRAFDLDPRKDEVALAFEWRGAPEYQRIRALGDGIVAALGPYVATGAAIYVMIDGDVAQTLGAMLRDECGLANEILVIDGITLRNFDFIDLGKIRLPSFTVPVTIKSLLFKEDPQASHRRERLHFHGDPRTAHHHSHDHAGPSATAAGMAKRPPDQLAENEADDG
jgi:ethanolamine utilization protein EutA